MKKTSLLLFIIFLTSVSFAQEATDKGYVAFSIGPGFPTGDYASSDIENDNAGLAGTGVVFDFSFAYRLGKHFGISAMLRGQSNPIDESAFISAANNSLPGISWSISADPWSHGGLLFGAYGSFPISNSKTCFETRLLFGYMNSTFPSIRIEGTAFGFTSSAVNESKTAGGLAVLLGGNFRFNVGSKISLLASMDFFGSSAEFKNVKTEYSDGSSDFDTFTQNFSSVNLGIGIAYRLGTTLSPIK